MNCRLVLGELLVKQYGCSNSTSLLAGWWGGGRGEGEGGLLSNSSRGLLCNVQGCRFWIVTNWHGSRSLGLISHMQRINICHSNYVLFPREFMTHCKECDLLTGQNVLFSRTCPVFVFCLDSRCTSNIRILKCVWVVQRDQVVRRTTGEVHTLVVLGSRLRVSGLLHQTQVEI